MVKIIEIGRFEKNGDENEKKKSRFITSELSAIAHEVKMQ